MDFLEVIKRRHSVRSYQQKTVTSKQINSILEVAKRAPSAGNLRAYRIIVAKDGKQRQAIAHAAFDQMWLAEAPVLFILVACPLISSKKYGKRGHFYSIQDATLAAAYLQLAIVNLGLSCGWVGAFADEQLSAILKLQENEFPIAVIPCGYAS